jgi:hypothetical protein
MGTWQKKAQGPCCQALTYQIIRGSPLTEACTAGFRILRTGR